MTRSAVAAGEEGLRLAVERITIFFEVHELVGAA
jgi:hypothetical protein